MTAAYAFWLIGEAGMLFAGAFALCIIIGDLRADWRRVLETLKGEDNE